MEITSEFFNNEVRNGKKPFTLNIEKDVRDTRRSEKAKENKVYYLKLNLLGKSKEPLQINPINTSSQLKSKSADKDKKNTGKKELIDTMVTMIRLDFKKETDEEIRERAEYKVDELMKLHNTPAEKRSTMINIEVFKMKGIKELSISIKYVDDHFKADMRKPLIKASLKKHCECKQKIKENAGVILYERNLNIEEELFINKLMKENQEGSLDEYEDNPEKRKQLIEDYLENVEVNAKTGKIRHEFPMVYLEIPVTKSTGALSIDILDMSNYTTDKNTGERKYKRATIPTKGPNGKMINVGLDFYNVATFVTYGSLILGMIEFTITISQNQGPKLHVKLIDQMYVRKGKSSRIKKNVAKSTVAKLSSILDAESHLYDNTDDPAKNESNDEEAEVNNKDNDLDGVDDDTSNVSDDAY